MTLRTIKKASTLLLCSAALACNEVETTPVGPGPSMTSGSTASTLAGEGNPGNRAPVIRGLRFEPAEAAAGSPIRVIADTFDADGDAVGLSFEWSLGGEMVRGDAAQMTFPRSKKRDWIEVTITPSDGKTEGNPMTAETRVANRAPSAISLRMEPSGPIQAGTPIIAHASAHDYDEEPVSFEYTWSLNGKRTRVNGDRFETDRLVRGDTVQVSVVASDGEAFSPTAVGPELEIQNSPPKITSRPNSPDAEGSFHYVLQVEDPDDRRLSYRLATAPDGMQIDPLTGEVDWKPRDDQIGSFPVEIVVDDRSGGSSRQSFVLTFSNSPEGSSEPPAALSE